MNKLIFLKKTLKFFIVSSVLLLISAFLKMLKVNHSDFRTLIFRLQLYHLSLL